MIKVGNRVGGKVQDIGNSFILNMNGSGHR
jgi:hypothetical protein